MLLLRLLALVSLFVTAGRIANDAGPGIDPNGGRQVTTQRCTGDYAGCVDPNG